ncbi:MAG: biotin--[acetyl-CoA-carboxylase] ligase [Candidatus Sabulitectum sp.]|nr:biotin--[acetyl-CoA-carboxylase] ligase [Candidatus Sabulitectum sp.]
MAKPYRLNNWLIFAEESVLSTQKWLRKRVAELSDRTVILAGTQTSGRGRSGREWRSPVGGFYTSFLLKPSPPIVLAPCVSLLAAVILTRLLKQQGMQAFVKWPNDVIVEGKKVAGMIAEAGSFPESWFILGIGVNLTEAPFIPKREFLPAGSWAEFGDAPAADELLQNFLIEFDSSWSNREDNPLDGITEELDSILWQKGEQVTLSGGLDTFQGFVSRINRDGSLVLLTDSGERQFVSGELLTVPEERG